MISNWSIWLLTYLLAMILCGIVLGICFSYLADKIIDYWENRKAKIRNKNNVY